MLASLCRTVRSICQGVWCSSDTKEQPRQQCPWESTPRPRKVILVTPFKAWIQEAHILETYCTVRINAITCPLSHYSTELIINLNTEAPERLEPPFHMEGHPGFLTYVPDQGWQGKKESWGQFQPCIFLSHLLLPALVSSEFSNSTLHLASNVYCFTLHCITPLDFIAGHASSPEDSWLETTHVAGLFWSFRMYGMEISRCSLIWQPAALANSLNLNYWYTSAYAAPCRLWH